MGRFQMMFLPMPIIATIIAFVYGMSLHRAWLSAILTFCLVMIGGLLYGGYGQIVAIVVSALAIFLVVTLPAQRRQAHEEYKRDRDAARLPNEEDY